MEEHKRTASSESFRSLRANLNYVLEETGASKVLVVTSAISGEGKSYCAKNLAGVLSLAGKKTLLINADMRKPIQGTSHKVSNLKGLSSYLIGKTPLTDILIQTDVPHFYLIESGAVPPNPSELLLGERMAELFNTARKTFDYVLVDTSPIGLVSDASALLKYADLTLFVVRQRYTEKPFLSDLEELRDNYQESNMAIVFNDVNLDKAGYGRYGYGGKKFSYYEEPKKVKGWWRKTLGSTN